MEPLYQVKVHCVYCETDFQTSKVRSSFKKSSKTDTDFGIHYKEINPDYYVVAVCAFCGYASTENFSPQLTSAYRVAFEMKVKNNWTIRDYSGERDWETALKTYQLALITAQVKQEKDRVVAGLLHHIAWLYREKGDEDQEKRFLGYALDAYVGVYETEGMNINNARLMYLIGELNRRLGQFNEAVKWFARVINDKRIIDAGMIRACRDQWAATREEMEAARMELPEEGKVES